MTNLESLRMLPVGNIIDDRNWPRIRQLSDMPSFAGTEWHWQPRPSEAALEAEDSDQDHGSVRQ